MRAQGGIAIAATVAAVLACVVPAVARADRGAWIWSETRVPIVGLPPELPRLSLRIWTDTRFMGKADGLAQQFLRVGPVYDPTPWLSVALHGTVYADRRPDGTFEQEARAEVEPTLLARLGPVTLSDRNRLEYRWREARSRGRYRNQLRVNYAPVGALVIPFVWDEVLVDLEDGWNENRAMAGLGVLLRPHIRLEGGYLHRTRDVAGDWQADHMAILFLSFGLPSRPTP